MSKFEAEVDKAVYEMSLDGGPDEEVGSSTEAPGTWAGLMRDGVTMAERIEEDRDEFPDVTARDIAFLRTMGRAGAIITESTDGSVSVSYYAKQSDLDKDWKETEETLTLDDEELEPNARRGGRRGRHRPNTSIADRRNAGVIEGLTKAEMDSMEIRIPTFDWKQVGGDMDPGAHGGMIAQADGQTIDMLEIQSVTDLVGEGEAKDVGFPFWSKEGSYDLDDLSLSDEHVQSAIESAGLGEHLLEMTPEQRAVAIAEACMSAGHRSEESTGGWAKDVLGSRKVVWWGSNGKAEGYEYIADEDDTFKRDVLEYKYELHLKASDQTVGGPYETEEEAIEAADAFEEPCVVVDTEDDTIVWDEEEDGEQTPNRGKKNSRVSGHTRNDSGGFRTVAAIKAANKRGGYHFFDADTIRFWNSEIEPKVYGGRFFVTSEQFSEEEPRLFSVREAEASGRVKTVAHRLPSKADAVSTIADLLGAHTPNPRRWPVLMSGNDPMSQLLDMEAESMDPTGQGDVPDEVRGALSYTDDLIRVVTQYEDALRSALEEVVEKYPPSDGASSDDLFDDEAPYLVLMTLRGEGVGIWDDWVPSHYSKDDIRLVQDLLKKKLGRYADDSGSGRISEELQAVVYEAMREAGYGLNDEGYAPLAEGEDVGYEFKDTELTPERVEVIVEANGIPTPKFWDLAGSRRPLTRGEVDKLVTELGGKFAKNARTTAFSEGDYVRPSASYLRSIGPTSGIINGVVTGLSGRFVLVLWNDREEVVAVAPGALELDPRLKGKKAPAYEYRKNMSSTRRWNVFLNNELLEPVYLPASLSASDVKQKLVRDMGYDERIVVDQPPERRSHLPAHYRTTLRENRSWPRSYMNDLPDSAFLYIEPGGSEDAAGRTTPRTLRHFPYKGRDGKVDLAHLRNALSRIPQSKVPEAAKRAARAHAEKLLAEHGGSR